MGLATTGSASSTKRKSDILLLLLLVFAYFSDPQLIYAVAHRLLGINAQPISNSISTWVSLLSVKLTVPCQSDTGPSRNTKIPRNQSSAVIL